MFAIFLSMHSDPVIGGFEGIDAAMTFMRERFEVIDWDWNDGPDQVVFFGRPQSAKVDCNVYVIKEVVN